MTNPGFWLVVAIFSLGLSWLLICLGGWVAQAMRWIDDRLDADLAQERADWGDAA